MLAFPASIVVLSAVQGASVALPSDRAHRLLARLRADRSETALGRLSGRWWGLLPPASIALFVLVGGFAASASASFLTYFALVMVPIGAALALGSLVHGARPTAALLVAPLFALAWADRAGLAGQAAALLLAVLSCATLGALLAAVTPPRWLGAGIVAMSLVDVALVATELLQKPNSALNAAHPVAGLPRLQAAVFGSAAMGYGDLFVAGLLGGLIAVTLGRRRQGQTALLAIVLALAFDALFFALNELPATVPIAVTLLLVLAWRHVRRAELHAASPRARRRLTDAV